jgi:hypothetical protein
MWQWLLDNHGAVSAIASILTLFVWGLYFQLLYNNYRRLRRPKILINRGAGQTVQARCIVANMSAESIYVEAVLVSFDPDRRDTEPTVCSLSDLDMPVPTEKDPRRTWLQGPLQSGELIDIGSYQSLIDKAVSGKDADATRHGALPLHAIAVTVVASYLSEDRLVAAERVFDLERRDAAVRLRPRSFAARQIRSRADRASIEALMMRDLRSSSGAPRA